MPRSTGGSEADRAATVAYLANQLEQSASGVVRRRPHRLANGDRHGRRHPRRHRASANVTTVDNVDTATGRLAAVLGLVEQNGGGVGRYGFGSNAQAQVPTLAVG